MKEVDIEMILERAKEKHPEAKPRIISDNGPKFIARDFKEFIRISQNPPRILGHPQCPALDLSQFALRRFQLWRQELTQRTVCICPPQPFGCRERILLIRGSSC